MPSIDVPLYKVVIRGSVETTDQTWSSGFYVARTGGSEPTQANVTTNSGGFAGLISTLATALRPLNAASTIVDGISCYYRPSGSTVTTLLDESGVGPTAGTAPAPANPSQLALVASLRTARPGRSGRGRMYWPYTASNTIDTGQAGTTPIAQLANQLAEMFTAVNASTPAEGGAFSVVVASFSKSLATVVSLVLVDSKIDTQRRREDKVAAANFASHAV